MSRRAGRWLLGGAILTVALGVSPRARASGDAAIPIVLAGLLLPAEVGVDVPIDSRSRAAGLVGWSYQLGLHDPVLGAGTRHRGVAGVDLLINGSGASCRGRLGYRYAFRDVFGGVGATLDGGGYGFSPELGFKFLHEDSDRKDSDSDASFHVIARAEIGRHGFESVTFMFGWNVL